MNRFRFALSSLVLTTQLFAAFDAVPPPSLNGRVVTFLKDTIDGFTMLQPSSNKMLPTATPLDRNCYAPGYGVGYVAAGSSYYVVDPAKVGTSFQHMANIGIDLRLGPDKPVTLSCIGTTVAQAIAYAERMGMLRLEPENTTPNQYPAITNLNVHKLEVTETITLTRGVSEPVAGGGCKFQLIGASPSTTPLVIPKGDRYTFKGGVWRDKAFVYAFFNANGSKANFELACTFDKDFSQGVLIHLARHSKLPFQIL